MSTSQGKRAYRSPERRARQGAARARMLAEARRLFAASGYVGTTIEDIASAAGLAVPTVYKHFGSKRAILAALIDSTIDARVPQLLDGVLAERDPRARVSLLAAMCVQLAGQAPDVVGAIVSAASVDPVFAQLLAELEEGRRRSAALVASSLRRDGALRNDVDEARARDVVWALAGPELYDLLVLRSGWTDDAFEAWLASGLISLLLAPA